MYYMMYGNNDYRDYVMAHSLGDWLKPTKYKDKIITAGGKVRYIYDDVKKKAGDFASKHITGSYYKKQGREAISSYNRAMAGSTNKNWHNEVSKRMNERVASANAGYNKSLAGRTLRIRNRIGSGINRARTSIGNAVNKLANTRLKNGVKLSTAVNHYLGRGRALVNKVLERIPGTARNKLRKQTAQYEKENKGKLVSKQTSKGTSSGGKPIKTTTNTYYGYDNKTKKKKKYY